MILLRWKGGGDDFEAILNLTLKSSPPSSFLLLYVQEVLYTFV